MKNLIWLGTALTALFLFSSCTPMKRAQTSLARGIAGSEVIKVGGHEVYCSEGKVCSEVDVLAISMEERDGGKIRVTLKNRTGNSALVQIHLEVRGSDGQILTETRPENVPLPATQEKTYEMPGVARIGATVRVIMNTAF